MNYKAKAKLESILEKAALIAALAVIPVIIIEQSNPNATFAAAANYANWMIWCIFLIEAIVLFAIADRKWLWISKHPLELAIIILSSPIMPPALQSTRAIRILRLLRLIRLARVPKLMHKVFSQKGLEWAAFLTAMIVIGGGSAFTIVEKGQNLSSWDGIYWALSTVTTYGSSVAPATTLGKIIAVMILFVGTGFIAILTAAVAERFMRYAKSNPDIPTADAEVMLQLQEINQRLRKIEKALKAKP